MATTLREVVSEVETAFLEANTKLAEVLRLAVEQTAAVAKARREEQRKLTIEQKIAKWHLERPACVRVAGVRQCDVALVRRVVNGESG
jgi:hypothetical protein